MATATKTEQTAKTRVPWRIKADSLESCNCNHGCGCQFGGFPDHGGCEFIIGYQVIDGRYGDVDLAGTRVVVTGQYPKAIHEGHGHVVLFIDESASQQQTDALTKIFTGQDGGMPWEAIAGTVERFEGPVKKPIAMKVEGLRSAIRIDGTLAVQFTPLIDPVTGQEKEVHIVYPKGGFFWNDGSICTTDTMRVSHGDLRLEYPGRFANHAVTEWTNQRA